MASRVYGGEIKSFYIAANSLITDGDLVCVNSNGFVLTATDTAGLYFIGVAEETKDNSLGNNGDLSIDVYINCTIEVVLSGVTVIDSEVYILDSATVQTAGNVLAGELRYITDSGSGYITVPQYNYYDSPLIGTLDLTDEIFYTNNRTDYRYEIARYESFPVGAGENIATNNLVAMSGNYLVNASDTAGLIVIGKALFNADNSLGADGALNVDVLLGGKEYFTTNGLAWSDVGHTCYIENTTTLTTAAISVNKITAGVLLWIDTVANRGLLRF